MESEKAARVASLKPKPRKYSRTDYDAIVKARDQGCSWTQIGEVYFPESDSPAARACELFGRLKARFTGDQALARTS